MTTKQMTTENTQQIEKEKTMTTVTVKNSKLQKYNNLLEASRTLDEQIEANRTAQEELILPKIRSLQTIGRSVYRKCTSGSYADLGDFSWINANLRLKSLNSTTITLSEVKSVWRNKAYEYEEVREIKIDRGFLHISDRDFAKLIRAQIWGWKNAEKEKVAPKPVTDELELAQGTLKVAQANAAKAERRIKALELELADRQAEAADRAARKAQGLERAQAARAAKEAAKVSIS